MAGRLGDEVAARRRARFVGRNAERRIFLDALAGESSIAVLSVEGVGGVGKSALLAVWREVAEAFGRETSSVDGHTVEPNPAAILGFLGDFGRGPGVLFLDHYELLAPADEWVRNRLVPGLAAGSLVVIAGREPLSVDWWADPGWRDLVRVVRLEDLPLEDAQAYLRSAGVSEPDVPMVFTLTHGHPLAMGVAVDVLRERGGGAGPELLSDPDVFAALATRFLDSTPGPRRQAALAAVVIARVTTEESLRAVLDRDDVAEEFAWLRDLSWIAGEARGLRPHDLAREVLDADLKWRDAQRYRQMWTRVRAHIQTRIKELRGPAQREAIFDLFFTLRHDAAARPLWKWETLGAVVPEPVGPEDRAGVLSLVAMHEGPDSAELAGWWLDRQPEAFQLYRNRGEVAGLGAFLVLTDADAAAGMADPVIAWLWHYIERHGPLESGDEVLVNRFRIDRDSYQGASPAQDLVTVTHFEHVVARPRLRWDVQVLADVEPYLAIARINFLPAPGPGPVVGGREYGLLVRDARAPSPVWDPIRPDPESRVLASSRSPEQLADVREALRNLHRPAQLRGSPLLAAPGVKARGGDESALIEAIAAAADRLRNHPRDVKLYRALDRTYLRPASSQEAAADVLGLPMTTFRRHLTQAVARVAEVLAE